MGGDKHFLFPTWLRLKDYLLVDEENNMRIHVFQLGGRLLQLWMFCIFRT